MTSGLLPIVMLALGLAAGVIGARTLTQSSTADGGEVRSVRVPDAISAVIVRDGSFEETRDRLAGLARRSDLSDWIALLIADETALIEPELLNRLAEADDAEAEVLLPLVRRDRLLLLALIESLGDDPDAAILWALTTRLTDRQTVESSEQLGHPLLLREIHAETSREIGELCRKKLHEALGVDFGDDIAAWRRAILERGD